MATTTPTSTYRLHLTSAFDLEDARALVEHIDDLGIDWLYLSPIQRVPAGATHGYHILDPDVVDPQLGGPQGLAALHEALTERGRGMVLDIVPNHMAASPENAWWADVLRHGAASEHADVFDVALDPEESGGARVVLPVLDRSVDEAIADGHLVVDTSGDEPVLAVGEGLRLPLAPSTDPSADIRDVLAAQHYALMHWQEGERVINWRRFFAVNELIGVRVEQQHVFDATHGLILNLVGDGTIDGLRIDHIDGLADPGAYLRRLRKAVGPDCWLVVEKILEQGEDLPSDWPVQGTTGYEVATALAAWLTDAHGYGLLTDAFQRRTGLTGPVTQELADSKRLIATTLFTAEFATVRRRLGSIDGISDDEVGAVLVDLAAHLPGYRTYAPLEGDLPGPSLDVLNRAAEAAAPAHSRGMADRVLQALVAPSGRAALIRLQQLTGAVAAKGFEDRLLFRHVALSSLCEVGADAELLDHLPGQEQIADVLRTRQADWPHAGTTTSTHDTKRAEDVRARIAVLAEIPEEFLTALADIDDAGLPDIGGHASWLLTQTAVGMLDLEGDDVGDITGRLTDYALKALREAEVDTSHHDPDAAFEQRVVEWVDGLTGPGPAAAALRTLADRVGIPGACNSLTNLVLKLVGPGVPDIYRGTEIWDASLVDPDNRRPLRVELLESARRSVARVVDGHPEAGGLAGAAGEMRRGWHDGHLKLHVTRTGLHLRRRHPKVFLDGALAVVEATGPGAAHVAAIQRDAPGHPAIIGVATRLPIGLADGGWPIGEVWAGTGLPIGLDGVTDLLTGRRISAVEGVLPMADVLSVLPVAMLVGDG